MSVPNLGLTTVLVVTYCYKLSTRSVEGKKRSEHRDKLRSFPMLIALSVSKRTVKVQGRKPKG